jgi:hypothetical protein
MQDGGHVGPSLPGGTERYQDARRQASALKVLLFHRQGWEFEVLDQARIDGTGNPITVNSASPAAAALSIRAAESPVP